MPSTTATSIELLDFKARQYNEEVLATATVEIAEEFTQVRNRILHIGIEAMEAVCEMFAIIEPVTVETIDLTDGELDELVDESMLVIEDIELEQLVDESLLFVEDVEKVLEAV